MSKKIKAKKKPVTRMEGSDGTIIHVTSDIAYLYEKKGFKIVPPATEMEKVKADVEELKNPAKEPEEKDAEVSDTTAENALDSVELEDMTVAELEKTAEEMGIDLSECKLKADKLAAILDVVS